jgi:hypothetical protein
MQAHYFDDGGRIHYFVVLGFRVHRFSVQRLGYSVSSKSFVV